MTVRQKQPSVHLDLLSHCNFVIVELRDSHHFTSISKIPKELENTLSNPQTLTRTNAGSNDVRVTVDREGRGLGKYVKRVLVLKAFSCLQSVRLKKNF